MFLLINYNNYNNNKINYLNFNIFLFKTLFYLMKNKFIFFQNFIII